MGPLKGDCGGCQVSLRWQWKGKTIKLHVCLEEICQVCGQFVQCGSPSDTSACFQVYFLKISLVISREVLFRVAGFMGNGSHDPHGSLPTDSIHSETWVDPGHILDWTFMSFRGPQTLTKLSPLTLMWRSLISHYVNNTFPTSAICVYPPLPLSSPLCVCIWGCIHVMASKGVPVARVRTCGGQRKTSKTSIIFHLSFPDYSLNTGSRTDLATSVFPSLAGQWAPEICQAHKTIACLLNECWRRECMSSCLLPAEPSRQPWPLSSF